MHATLSSESADWVVPSYPTMSTAALPNFEESLPNRVNKESVNNYVRNRGTLNLGDWAIEARKRSSSAAMQNENSAPPRRVMGADAERNCVRGRSSTPNLIYGNLDPPNPHHRHRVKREAQANYEKNQQTQMKSLLDKYGKLPLPAKPEPHTQGEIATSLYHAHREGRVGALLHNYGNVVSSTRPISNTEDVTMQNNLQRSYGVSKILRHEADLRPTTAEPNVKGVHAQSNYDLGQGQRVAKLFYEYGKLPQSSRAPPKVKYGGVENLTKDKGDAMRKTLSQCPPSTRLPERLQPVHP